MPVTRIPADEVARWLEGSVLSGPVWHRSRAHAAILEDGLRVDKAYSGACRGIYCSVEPWLVAAGSGNEELVILVVVQLFHPMTVAEQADIPEAVGLPRHGDVADQARERLLERGFDGVITTEENPTLIALSDRQVRVVDPPIALTIGEIRRFREAGLTNPLPELFQ
jgi:hypothetical protein